MNPALYEAIESARSREAGFVGVAPVDRGKPTRFYSFQTIQTILYNVIRELPEDMTVLELRRQLEGE